MKIFYDTEFLEDGQTIDLISIGMVTATEETLYLINKDAPWERIMQHKWLVQNVLPHLDFNPFVLQPIEVIAERVKNFILKQEDPELWAWFGAYDHVVLAQLWGSMDKMPKGVPYWTNDLRQEYHRLEVDHKVHQTPSLLDNEHHALSDAKDLMRRFNLLETEIASGTYEGASL